MAMTSCKECRKPISSEASVCPHCGITSRNRYVEIAKLVVWFLLIGYCLKTIIGWLY